MMTQRALETFEEYQRRYYRRLTDGVVKVKLSENVYKCPYCHESREYDYDDLCRHASRIATESKSADLKEKAKHMGLLEFLARSMKVSTSKSREEIDSDIDMASVMKQKERIIKNFNRDLKILQEKANKKVKKIILEHEQSKMNGSETMEQQKKADDHEKMLKLVDDQKKVIENLENQIMELQKKLEDKQSLELEIHQMKEDIGAMKKLTDENVESKKKMESILEELKETKADLEGAEQLNQTLIVTERLKNDELQDARKVLLSGLKENHGRSNSIIGVKRLGELDEKPFVEAAKRYKSSKTGQYGICLVSLWEDRLRDPSWHPFKIITVDGESKEVVDEEDEKLSSLKGEHDDEVYNAVVTALKELNHYNPSGRCPLLEVWNYKEKRKATVGEGIQFIQRQLKRNRQPIQD